MLLDLLMFSGGYRSGAVSIMRSLIRFCDDKHDDAKYWQAFLHHPTCNLYANPNPSPPSFMARSSEDLNFSYDSY